MQTIKVQDLHEILADNSPNGNLVVDIRNEDEYSLTSIPGSVNIPTDKLGDNIEKLSQYKSVYIYCNTDARSIDACDKLKDLGLQNVTCVEGGLSAWMVEDNDVSGGRHTKLSMLQQVHLGAAIFVLVPTFLALSVNINFMWIVLLPGFGLLGSGLTGFCGMTYVLGKMPWNK